MEPERSTIWPFDEKGVPGRFYYSRNDHPAGAAAEAELGRLEGGDALLYASGMGAITTILLAFGRAGAKVAVAEGAYYGTGKLIRLLADWELEIVEFDQTKAAPADAQIVIVEAPANPVLTMPDLEALRSHPGLV